MPEMNEKKEIDSASFLAVKTADWISVAVFN